MNVAEWVLVVILAVTLFVFLVIGIILMVRLLGLTDEARKVVVKSQDIADNANDVVMNVRGMTSIINSRQPLASQLNRALVTPMTLPLADRKSTRLNSSHSV